MQSSKSESTAAGNVSLRMHEDMNVLQAVQTRYLCDKCKSKCTSYGYLY